MVLINPETKEVLLSKVFDTFKSSVSFENQLKRIPFGTIVAIAVSGDGAKSLS